jgi:hypothetical chaperone protein
MPVLAVDFGTSNTAAAVLDGGAVRRLRIEGDADTLPTAVFFPARGGTMQIGAAATAALIAGDEGRYMRALKSVLGAPLFHEPRLIAGRRRTLAEVVAAFLSSLKTRAEAELGQPLHAVLSGRPVRFHPDPARDAQAEADLRGCWQAAGFAQVDFLPEPEAAALACGEAAEDGAPGLVVDIGGGTSDFTLFRRHGTRVETLASHGIRLGGTDFDHAVSMAHAMPRLGLGGQLRRVLGDGLLPVPRAPYVDLATWAMIPFLYTPETRRLVDDMVKTAVDPAPMRRLAAVIRHELGHDLAFAVEAGKIAANAGDRGAAIAMGMIEPGLSAPLPPAALAAALHDARAPIAEAIRDTLFRAGTDPLAVKTVVLVGGSSLLGLVQDECRAACPAARLHTAEVFSAVADGLALATA